MYYLVNGCICKPNNNQPKNKLDIFFNCIQNYFYGKNHVWQLATTVHRRSFSSLIKQRLACLIQQSSKLIISIINFLPTGICISGWWQLGASPLHSQVTLLAKSGTNVKKIDQTSWYDTKLGVKGGFSSISVGEGSKIIWAYFKGTTGGGLIKCVWPPSLLCLYIVTLFINKRFVLNEMFQRNASKFAIFYV